MNEMKDELFAAPVYEWHHVPFTENHHKWWFQWYRIGEGEFFFSFLSPKKRRYSFYTEGGENGGRVVGTDIVGPDNGARIAWYWESWGDSPARFDAVLRLTPKHIIDRLRLLLSTIG